MNHISIIDKALSDKECNIIIKKYSCKIEGSLKEPWNYDFCDIPQDKILDSLSKKLVEQYKKDYPEVNITNERWSLKPFKFKIFKPGNYYSAFHSEQGFSVPRIFSILVYLSDHNCGTEFYNKTIVKSVKGRALIFPSYWTHAHRGQPCPDNETRYILSAYAILDEEID